MARGSKKKKRFTDSSPVAVLSDDLLVDIISCVPFKSTHCCKCVCRRCRDVVSHPDHRKKLPQSTVAGFFYKTYNVNRSRRPVSHRYQSVSGNWCPSIDNTLIPARCKKLGIDMLDCCNGLLLFLRCRKRKGIDSKILDYMVCNPATETWVAVPATEWSEQSEQVRDTRLGFNPAVSSHFYVFEFVYAYIWEADKGRHSWRIKSVGIYSSEAGVWTHRSAWYQPIAFYSSSRSAFLDGALYLSSHDDFVIAVVDVEGNCRVIPFPTPHGSPKVYVSRGQLYLATYGGSDLSIWALEDSSTENWTLKHNVNHLQLFGEEYSSLVRKYDVIIHPEHSVIFIVCKKVCPCCQPATKLMSYGMDSGELRFISDLGCGCAPPYLPYVPLFSESLAGGH